MAPTARYESDNVSPDPLAKPLEFGFSGKTANNRFLKAAMTERLSSWDPKDFSKRGIPSTNLINTFKRWGEGEVGTILTGNIMVEFDQLEAAGNPIIPRGEDPSGSRFEAFKELASASKAQGSLIVGQVSHPGRQVSESINKDPISASDVQLEGNVMGMTFAKPHPASQGEIDRVVEGFAHAAEYLHKAGYDGIQLHGAHGYLLAQFLAASTNKRTDKYGGNLENRSRIIIEIAQAIRKRVPKDFMLGIKINSVEFQKGGFDTEECKNLCISLEANEFDFVELSGGTYEELAFAHKRDSTKQREAFFLEFAEIIVPALKKTRTYITGGFKTVGAMVKALDIVDGVGLARPICQEPRICKDILSGKIKGAIKQRTDDQNFGLTNVAAGSQIRMIGKDQEPIDLSQEANEQALMKDMGHWSELMSADTVLDGGTGFLKVGYAAQNFPEHQYPSIVGRPILRSEERAGDVVVKDIMCGDEAAAARSHLQITYPMENGIVKRWDDMSHLWDFTFYEKMQIDPTNRKILLTEPPMNPLRNREQMCEVMFERYGFGGVYVAIQAVLALYAQGLSSGVVVDSGDGVTHIVPVYESTVLNHLTRRLDVAGRDVTRNLIALLLRRGYALNRTADFETVRQIKEKLCYVSYDLELDQRLSEDTTVLVESYTLPDGRVIRVGSERFEAPECLFQPHLVDVEQPGIAEFLFNTIQAADVDIRSSLYKAIVLSGGSSMYPGLPSRMEKEIKQLWLTKVLGGIRRG
ncbi:uncharacterized protein KY384_008080 [Bacidia gigantensis]|uniref:uncharacterized protein n=1 Tax=Bacidia gigantensis TaxID=2732470 RepID=UPI001D04C5E6|nr:uncharacterized protein KY384_008080 [Bacidia gigantensis]KAG8526651.1 hypothetical protein KY384_008080 [Bacidia gigantensis]